MKIDKLLPDLKDFKVLRPQTLFEPEWKNLQTVRCPFCGNLLKYSMKTDIYYCRNKKHKRGFAMKREKLLTYILK